MNFLNIILILIIFEKTRMSVAQFEDLKSCTMDRKFQIGVAKAFASKFIDMLDPILGAVEERLDVDRLDILDLFKLQVPSQPSFIEKITKKSKKSLDPWQDHDDEFFQDEMSQFKEQQLYRLLGFDAIENKIKRLVGRTQMIGKMFGGLVQLANPAQDPLALNDTRDIFDNFTVSGESLEEINRIHKCLTTFTDTDFEDSLVWLRCFYVCNDLRSISEGIGNTMMSIESCSKVQWFGDLIIRVFCDLMQLDNCFVNVLSPTSSEQPLRLVEGDQTIKTISFQAYASPGMHCFPPNIAFTKFKLAANFLASVFAIKVACPVEIQFSSSNYLQDLLPYVDENLPLNISTRPRCHNGSSINQVSIGWHENAQNSSGVIRLTNSNWNQTFVIPVVATVDLKMEHPQVQNTNFSLKFVANGKRLNTKTIELEVKDRDSKSKTVCQAVNVQHIITFDNLYYNTLYEGYFTLYKHTTLPYQVQVAYQQCDSTAGVCLCAAAVMTGDDVLVIDRCRVGNATCSPQQQPGGCDRMGAALYVNEGLTNGTAITKLDAGMAHQIVLPHGTVVKIKSSGESMIDIWVAPSPYDRDQTVGLCGTFNDLESDDLLHSDNTTTIPGSGKLNQPRHASPIDFIQSWRVPENERLFSGAPRSAAPFRPLEFCQCSHLLLRGQRCQCGFTVLVETCDLETGDPYTSDNISMIWKKSLYGTNQPDLRDIDISYKPPTNRIPTSNNGTLIAYCAEAILSSAPRLVTICAAVSLFNFTSLTDDLEQSPITRGIYACVDNFVIVGKDSDKWKRSYIDSAQQSCMFLVNKSPRVRRLMVNSYKNETCPGKCSGSGVCAENICYCDASSTGYDCSIPAPPPIPTIIAPEKVYCDQRYENCAFIPFSGYYLLPQGNLYCTVKQTKVKDTDIITNDGRVVTDVNLISMNQAVCLPPVGNFSYLVDIPVGNSKTTSFAFYVYDSQCFVCDPKMSMCTRKLPVDYCIINNQCYADTQPLATDFCYVCNVTVDTGSFSQNQDARCQTRFADEQSAADARRKRWTIRVAISVTLSIIVVVVTIILFILDTRKSGSKKEILDDNYTDDQLKRNNKYVSSDELEAKTTLSDDLNFNHLDKIPTESTIGQHADEDLSTTQSSSTSSTSGTTADKIGELTIVVEEPSSPSGDDFNEPLKPLAKNDHLLKVDENYGVRSRSISASSVHKKPNHTIHSHRTRMDSTSSVGSYGMGGGGPMLFGVHDRVNRAYVHSDEEADGPEPYGMGGHGWVTSGPHPDRDSHSFKAKRAGKKEKTNF